MFAALRLAVGAGGALLFALGLLLLIGGTPGSFPLLVAGAIGIVAGVWERTRYRSLAAERGDSPPGPGGGEPPDTMDARFTRTEEVFVDPTSGRVMRVYLDSSTGERRYRAEG
ncbi:MAG TPA: hypothetical protein VFM74_05300 [Candidatus Limnocylindria bacterium]|nr:hypothetical protein [Candidatus Limnocylindria bacterium]